MIEALFQALCAALQRTDAQFAGRELAASETELSADPPVQPTGCGWFDSSHDLASGLRVQELATPEALAQALPLGSWLELELAGCSR